MVETNALLQNDLYRLRERLRERETYERERERETYERETERET
jgi:hypothetical protein